MSFSASYRTMKASWMRMRLPAPPGSMVLEPTPQPVRSHEYKIIFRSHRLLI